MAIVTRYFSTTSAGAGDGTTWADRAALFSSGNWSSVITGFNFSGSDSLLCLIGPGTYTCSQSLETGTFTNAPTTTNNLFLHGCDSSGDKLAPSNPDWVSSQPVNWDSSLPVIEVSGDRRLAGIVQCLLRLLKITASDRNSGSVISNMRFDWCVVSNGSSNTAVESLAFPVSITNSAIAATGTAYSVVLREPSQFTSNVRVSGNPSATSGSRRGATFSGGSIHRAERLTIFGNIGAGIINTGTQHLYIASSVSYNNGNGVEITATSQNGNPTEVKQCVVVGGTYGVLLASGNTAVVVSDSRLRDNTSGNISGSGNFPTDFNNDTSATGADQAARDDAEFVDAAGGDFRIKNTSELWGKGYGAGDQPAAGGGGGGFYVSQSARMLR
jgi:hypothetical protein